MVGAPQRGQLIVSVTRFSRRPVVGGDQFHATTQQTRRHQLAQGKVNENIIRSCRQRTFRPFSKLSAIVLPPGLPKSLLVAVQVKALPWYASKPQMTPLRQWKKWALLAAVGTLAAGCNDGKAAKAERPSPEPKPSARSPVERLNLARQGCYVGRACRPDKTRALLDSARSEVEKQELQKAAGKALAEQLQGRLAKKHNQLVSVSAEAKTLEIRGVCNRIILQNAIGACGGHAKLLGLVKIRCESKALKADVTIPESP